MTSAGPASITSPSSMDIVSSATRVACCVLCATMMTGYSHDLGYTLCTVTVEIPGGIRRASWDATIWQRDPAGNWRIAVDISTPLPS